MLRFSAVPPKSACDDGFDFGYGCERGEVYGFLGPNGAGKTTTIKIAVGLLQLDEGEISINGKDIRKDFEGAMANVGGIVENPEMYKYLSGLENLRQYARMREGVTEERIKEVVELVRLSNRINDKVSKYSLGMRQRLGVAQAILHRPKLLILDEPTNGLDPIGIAEVRDFIKTLSIERGKTILISSHILSEIALLADDIGIIDHGVLLEENSMNELQKKNSKYILLQVSDIPKTSLVLERQFGVTEYSVQDEHTLRIYDTSLDMAAVNKALVVQDISVISSQLCNDTLEDYFKKITGGEGIA